MNRTKILPILIFNILASFCMLNAMSEPTMVPMATMQDMMKLSVKQAVKDELRKSGLGPKRWITTGSVLKYGIPAAAIGFGGYYLYKKSAWLRQLANHVIPATRAQVDEIKTNQDAHREEDRAGHKKTHELLAQVAQKEDISNLGNTITENFTNLWNGIRGFFGTGPA